MNKETFLEELRSALNRDDELTADMSLLSIFEWDSLGVMCTVSMFEEILDIQLGFEELSNMTTVQDLLNKAGIK